MRPRRRRRAGGVTLCFATIAIGDGYGWGEAYGFETRQQAESMAPSDCRKNTAN